MTDEQSGPRHAEGGRSARATRADGRAVYLLPDVTDPGPDASGPADLDPPDDARPPSDVDADRDPTAGESAGAPDDDGGSGDVDADFPVPRNEWPWVVEWRAGREPTPWATGLGLSGFAALVVGVAIWVLSAGLADRPIVAVLVNLLVAGGLAPAMWLSRDLPVLRWIAAGAVAGVVGGWIAALMLLPAPTP